MDNNNLDNIFLINKECSEIKKKISEIDKIIKKEEIKKKTLLDRLKELVKTRQKLRKKRIRTKKRDPFKKKYTTVVDKPLGKYDLLLKEAKEFNKKIRGRTIRTSKYKYKNNVNDNKDRIVINVCFSNINNPDPHKQTEIRNNILKRMMVKKIEDGFINYKFYKESNNLSYSDIILEILKGSKNYKSSDKKIVYSNIDMFSSISHKLYCFDSIKYFYYDKLTTLLKDKFYIRPRLIWNVKSHFPYLNKNYYWYILHNNERFLITNDNKKKLLSEKNEGTFIIQSSFKTKSLHNKKWSLSIFVPCIFISNSLYTFMYFDGIVNYYDNKSKSTKFSELGNYKKLTKKIKEIIYDVSEEMYKKIDKFYVSKYIEELQLYEFILLIDENGDLILHNIEINSKPYYNKKLERDKYLFYKSLFYNFINRLYFPNNKISNDHNKFMLVFSKKLKPK